MSTPYSLRGIGYAPDAVERAVFPQFAVLFRLETLAGLKWSMTSKGLPPA